MVDVTHGGRSTDAGDVDLEQEEGLEDYDNVLPVDIQARESSHPPRRVLSRVLSAVFPSPSNEEEIQAYLPHYRTLPILSGIAIPFSILLEIPGITSDWYTQTEGSTVITSEPNPLLLSVGIALSLFCAVLANVCLVVRFLERRVTKMTILCVVFLSIHDVINITALVTLGRIMVGHSLEHPFWLILCSTIASVFTSVTLIIDLIWTNNFEQGGESTKFIFPVSQPLCAGSGLTRRQRSLVIIIIGLFCYLALGALVNSLLLDLSFINGLYFTVVTIETIGFGDIVPHSSGSRVFICFYATLGVINLAFVVGYVRETVLEGLDFGYRKRIIAVKGKRRATALRRCAENRWRHAVVWRLRERHAPAWIPKNDQKSFWSKLHSFVWRAEWGARLATRRNTDQIHGRHGTKLNLWALPHCELEAAALEVGIPLDTLLPEDFYDTYNQERCNHSPGVEHHALPSWFVVHPVYRRPTLSTMPLTHRRLGAMAVMLSKQSFAVYESHGTPLPDVHGDQDDLVAQDTSGSLIKNFSDDSGDYRKAVADAEKNAYVIRSGLSWGLFLVFWMGGAAIFKATEGWSYGSSIYFCFVSFSTIGYGDLAPVTLVGRAIFVVWALIGVATMTIDHFGFVSDYLIPIGDTDVPDTVVSEAYTSRYKGILGHNYFEHVVKTYRSRTEVELSEKMQHVSAKMRFFLNDTVEREATDVVEDESPPVSGSVDDITPTLATAPVSQHSQAQRFLEQLPQQILTEARSIQQYVQLIGDFDKRSTDMGRFVDQVVWDLLDEVIGERKLTGSSKMDLLHDAESRQTLMVLGIKRSLKELMGISEQAIGAIQQQHRINALSRRVREEDEVEMDCSSRTTLDSRVS
ncbi:hypothetical protein JVU11DRAFT_8054 [Chiua virens]|nr:hypothetical protein JVU11DRAFT_8054 [Chiua virens]